MSTWKPHRSPLRAHLGFQANMTIFSLWTIQNAPRARARGMFCLVHGLDHTPDSLCTSESNRSPLKLHLGFPGQRGNLFIVDNTRLPTLARASGTFCMANTRKDYTRNQVNLEIQSVAAKGSLGFPSQHGDFSIVDNTAHRRARARGCARLRVVRCSN